jgi:hypothetical protein
MEMGTKFLTPAVAEDSCDLRARHGKFAFLPGVCAMALLLFRLPPCSGRREGQNQDNG